MKKEQIQEILKSTKEAIDLQKLEMEFGMYVELMKMSVDMGEFELVREIDKIIQTLEEPLKKAQRESRITREKMEKEMREAIGGIFKEIKEEIFN